MESKSSSNAIKVIAIFAFISAIILIVNTFASDQKISVESQEIDGGNAKIVTNDDTASNSNYINFEAKPVVDTGANFKFAAAGDFGNTERAFGVIKGMSDSNADFTLALGDLGYSGLGNEQKWCDRVNALVGNDFPFQLIAGNHDANKDGNILEYRKCLPNRVGEITGNYGVEYYFDYNNLARFILITPKIAQVGDVYEKGNERYQWVSDAIDDAKDKNIKWVVLGMHKNCVTPGVKACDIGIDILNLAVGKNVALVLQGHEHGYYRSKQLNFADGCPALVVKEFNEKCISNEGDNFDLLDGTIIAIPGTGGRALRATNPKNVYRDYFDVIIDKSNKESYGFNMFEVSENSIKASFTTTSGTGFTDDFIINN